MSLEQKINDYLKEVKYHLTPTIEGWAWTTQSHRGADVPNSFIIPINYVDEGKAFRAWKVVDDMIKEAPLEVCLTSPAAYIRECKKWFEAHKNDD